MREDFRTSSNTKPLKILILLTLVTSLLSALCDRLLPYFFGLTSPQQILGLSTSGIEHLYVWEFLTYLFVSPAIQGISFSLLISLAFNAYLLWILGTAVVDKKGSRHFFSLYFLGGLAASVSVFAIQLLTHSNTVFAGSSPALYAILIGWIMLYPEVELLLFLTFPIKAKWLATGLIGANILIDLSVGDWLSVIANLSSCALAYVYGLLIWNEFGPFPLMRPIEKPVMSLTKPFLKKQTSTQFYKNAKIFDFKTGKAILKDEEFLDAVLTKISLHGRSSLTWRERLRLKRISKKQKTAPLP